MISVGKIVSRFLAVMFTLAMAAQVNAAPSVFTAPYAQGPLLTRQVNIASGQNGSPRSAVAVFPQNTASSYPLIVFHHGFQQQATSYTDLFSRIASYGYIVVAPQLSNNILGSFQQDVLDSVQFLNWCGSSLSTTLQVVTDPRRAIIAGHSRGAKVAFSVMNTNAVGLTYSLVAVAGVDPVADLITARNFTFTTPALTIGAELGTTAGTFACNPQGRNSPQFYAACQGPVLWASIPRAGHGDMMNTAQARLSSFLCRSGGLYDQTRATMGGLLVNFFSQVFSGLPISPPAAQAPMTVVFQKKN